MTNVRYCLNYLFRRLRYSALKHQPMESHPCPLSISNAPSVSTKTLSGDDCGSPRERAMSPSEFFCRGMPKAIIWADVARQFAPIHASVRARSLLVILFSMAVLGAGAVTQSMRASYSTRGTFYTTEPFCICCFTRLDSALSRF